MRREVANINVVAIAYARNMRSHHEGAGPQGDRIIDNGSLSANGPLPMGRPTPRPNMPSPADTVREGDQSDRAPISSPHGNPR